MARYSSVYYADRRVGVWDIMTDTYKHWFGDKNGTDRIGVMVLMSKEQMSSPKGFIDLSDPTQKIYRVTDFNYLHDMYQRKKIVLTRPSKWQDPFENCLLTFRIIDKATGKEIGIRPVMDIFFGQCWSYQETETDATWRIYAPHDNAVRISSTVEKLFNAILGASDRPAMTDVFIGNVSYDSADNILAYITNPANAHSVIESHDGYAAARWLLVKRNEFAHEHEIRVLLRDPLLAIPKYEPKCELSINPHELIDEIVYDPRMPEYRADVYTDQLSLFGATAKIRRSELYSLPKMTVEIEFT